MVYTLKNYDPDEIKGLMKKRKFYFKGWVVWESVVLMRTILRLKVSTDYDMAGDWDWQSGSSSDSVPAPWPLVHKEAMVTPDMADVAGRTGSNHIIPQLQPLMFANLYE